MNQILRCDWLPDWARWSLGITRCIPQENSVLFPYNKSFIDQAGSVKKTRYWPRLGPKQAKKELGQYPAILTVLRYVTENPWELDASKFIHLVG